MKRMGFIKEPEGIDFIINSKPLTDKERQEISLYIKAYKSKTAEQKSRKL
jgi:hypothetical protein